jgi:hypothetical protein
VVKNRVLCDHAGEMWAIHPKTRPAPAPPERLSDASKLAIATAVLERVQTAIINGLHTTGPRGKPRRMAARDRDAVLLVEIDRAIAALRR